MIHALIFDFDGLIVDTETPAFESWRMVYAEYGYELPFALWIDSLGTSHGFDSLAHLAELLVRDGRAATPAILNAAVARRQELKTQLSADQPLLPGVLEKLDQADAGALPAGVASSSSRAWVTGWLAYYSIATRFRCVRTADDVTRTKPSPELFLSAASCLKVAPASCLVFEDSPNGILAARAAGMRCVAVPGAVSRQVELPPADLTVASLAEMSLQQILEFFA